MLIFDRILCFIGLRIRRSTNNFVGRKAGKFMQGSKFAKGMATGMVLGACAVMIAEPITNKQRNKFKKKTQGIFKSVGSMIDTAIDIIK